MAKRLETLSLNFDDTTAEETERHQRMAEEVEFSQRCEVFVREEMQAKYRSLLIAVKESGINIEDVYADILAKKRHLRNIMNYDVLIGKNGEPVKLKDADPSCIGKAYLHICHTAKKALNK